MMANFQHGAFQSIAGFQNFQFFLAFRVSGEEERGITVFDSADNRHVVRVVACADRPDDLACGAPQRERIAGRGNRDGYVLRVQILDKAMERSGIVLGHRAVCHVNAGVVQRTGKATDMIFVRMGADDVVQVLYAVIFQIGIDQAGVRRVSAVNQHRLVLADDQRRIRLSDVEVVNLEERYELVGVGLSNLLRDRLWNIQ